MCVSLIADQVQPISRFPCFHNLHSLKTRALLHLFPFFLLHYFTPTDRINKFISHLKKRLFFFWWECPLSVDHIVDQKESHSAFTRAIFKWLYLVGWSLATLYVWEKIKLFFVRDELNVFSFSCSTCFCKTLIRGDAIAPNSPSMLYLSSWKVSLFTKPDSGLISQICYVYRLISVTLNLKKESLSYLRWRSLARWVFISLGDLSYIQLTFIW